MKQIPISNSFFITKDGRVFDSEGTERNYYSNLDGYKTVSIKTLNDKWVTYGVHRLVAITYKPCDDWLGLAVNHINGNKLINEDWNVEWTTVKQNNSHAVLLNRNTKRPLIRSSKNGIKTLHLDIQDAEEYFGVDIEQIWYAIKMGVLLNDETVSLIKHGDTEVTTMINKELGTTSSYRRKVKMLDLVDGWITYFNSMHDAARSFGVIVTFIRNRLSVPERPKIFYGRYAIVDEDNNFDHITEEVKSELLARGKRKVYVYNTKSFVFETYDSASSYINKYGLSKKAVTVRLKNNDLRVFNDWIFSYHEKDITEKASSL